MYYVVISACVVALDFITKYLAVEYLEKIGTFPLIKNVFHLTYVENTGAAFGILKDARWVFISLTILVVAGIIYMIRVKKFTDIWLKTALALIIGGAAGNLIDRVFLGYVVDFFDFRLINFAVFNVADSCIVIGAVILLLYVVVKKDGEI